MQLPVQRTRIVVRRWRRGDAAIYRLARVGPRRKSRDGRPGCHDGPGCSRRSRIRLTPCRSYNINIILIIGRGVSDPAYRYTGHPSRLPSGARTVKNISFSLTSDQFTGGSKTVTRRVGWKNLAPGALLMVCRKCQGLRPGESLERLGPIRVVSVRREPLNAIDQADVIREGFPEMTPADFVSMFCEHMSVVGGTLVTRIEFERIADD